MQSSPQTLAGPQGHIFSGDLEQALTQLKPHNMWKKALRSQTGGHAAQLQHALERTLRAAKLQKRRPELELSIKSITGHVP